MDVWYNGLTEMEVSRMEAPQKVPEKGVSFEAIIAKAMELPLVKIDREKFLTKQFGDRVNAKTMNFILAEGTVKAHVKQQVLDKMAKEAIIYETAKVTAIATVADIPGGLAMIGTVPADLAQFYAHVFRIAQKLAYIYGWQELSDDDGTQNRLILFLGVMTGVQAAGKAVMKFALEAGPKIGARVAAKPLMKTAWYPVLRRVLRDVGIKMTKPILGKTIATVVPILGGVVSGGLAVATFRPMAKKLAVYLSKMAQMTPEDFEAYYDNQYSILDAGFEITDDDAIVEVV